MIDNVFQMVMQDGFIVANSRHDGLWASSKSIVKMGKDRTKSYLHIRFGNCRINGNGTITRNLTYFDQIPGPCIMIFKTVGCNDLFSKPLLDLLFCHRAMGPDTDHDIYVLLRNATPLNPFK